MFLPALCWDWNIREKYVNTKFADTPVLCVTITSASTEMICSIWMSQDNCERKDIFSNLFLTLKVNDIYASINEH